MEGSCWVGASGRDLSGWDPPDDSPDDGIPFVGLTVTFGPLRTFGPLGTFGCFGTLGPFGTLGASVATLDAWPFRMLHTFGCFTLRDAPHFGMLIP